MTLKRIHRSFIVRFLIITLQLTGLLILRSESSLPFIDLPPQIIDGNTQESAIKHYTFESESDTSSISLERNLTSIPGVSLLKRGANSLEPNLRGFTGGRVTLTWDGHPLPIAAPTRTASGINFISPNSLSHIQVAPAFPSSTAGPISIGGVLSLSPDSTTERGQFQFIHNSNQALQSFNGSTTQNWEKYRISASAFSSTHGDYRAGDGRMIDADFESRGGQITLVKEINHNRFKLSMAATEQLLARNSSLPLDSKGSTFAIVSLKYQRTLDDWVFQTRAAYSKFNIHMTAEDRKKPAVIHNIEADSISENASFGLEVSNHNDFKTIKFGIDGYLESRDSNRTRDLKPGVFRDHLWPNIKSKQIGIFTEYQQTNGERYSFRVGGRLDIQNRQAKSTHDVVSIPNALGATILENYIAYNGSAAGKTSTRELLGATNAIVSYNVKENLTLTGGIGIASALPDITYQYRSFVSALGGDGKGGSAFEMGNPALNPERKTEIDLGMKFSYQWIEVNAGVYFAKVDDFIMRTITQGSKKPIVFSYQNQKARFNGTYIYGRGLLKTNVSIPFQFSWTNGQTDSGDRLAEIPPWNANCGIEWKTQIASKPMKIESRMTYTASRTNPAPETVPIYQSTKAYTLLSMRFSYELTENISLLLDAQNLLDQHYYHYLQPPVSSGPQPSSGDLKAGDSIPGIGRSFVIHFKWIF